MCQLFQLNKIETVVNRKKKRSNADNGKNLCTKLFKSYYGYCKQNSV